MTILDLLQRILNSREKDVPPDLSMSQAWEMACDLVPSISIEEIFFLDVKERELLANCARSKHIAELRRAYNQLCPDGESPGYVFAGFIDGKLIILNARFLSPGLDIRAIGENLSREHGGIPIWYAYFEATSSAGVVHGTPYN